MNRATRLDRTPLRNVSRAIIHSPCDRGGRILTSCGSLNMQWFKNRINAKILIEEFRRQFNEIRPYSSLGNLTPAEFKRRLSTTNPETAISEA